MRREKEKNKDNDRSDRERKRTNITIIINQQISPVAIKTIKEIKHKQQHKSTRLHDLSASDEGIVQVWK